MISSTSTFVASSIILPNNAVKSIIFRCAELLISLAVYKFSALFAAKLNLFTPYLMFAEDYVQRGWYMFSQRVSSSTILVLCFTLLYVLAQLFGTLLWSLDSPGYVMQSSNVSGSEVQSARLSDPAYIVYLSANASDLASVDKDLPRALGANLFNGNLNVSLTGRTDRGERHVARPTRAEVGGRIWLDDQGFSVSPDSEAMVLVRTEEDGTFTNSGCPIHYTYTGSYWAWTCSFNNSFTGQMLDDITTRPEVHWDDDSDREHDSRYISLNRQDNMWTTLGKGGGTTAMKQVFTVTKGKNRHLFVQTTYRISMVAPPTAPLQTSEMSNLLRRAWSLNATDQHSPFIDSVLTGIMKAQKENHSFMYGVNTASDFTASQVSWDYLTYEVDQKPTYSILRVSVTNITLVRSETLDHGPTPLGSCDASFQNQAYGGKLTNTDCLGSKVYDDSHFFGQVDTSAMLIMYGLGNGRSNVSSEALEQSVWEWSVNNSDRIDDLLLARGFMVSVSPSLVTVELSTVRVAMSHLQILFVLVAVLLSGIAWLSVFTLADPHWSNSFLSNVISTTSPAEGERYRKPGYMHKDPDVQLRGVGREADITVDGKVIVLKGDVTSPTESTSLLVEPGNQGLSNNEAAGLGAGQPPAVVEVREVQAMVQAGV